MGGNLARIQHPNIVRLTGVVRDGEDWYLQMPFYPKGDLRYWIETKADAALRATEAGSILRCVLKGLQALHQVGWGTAN